MSSGAERRLTAQRLAPLVGGLASLALHGALYAGLSWATTLPSMGIELELPTEVEFGVTEATVAAVPPAPPEPVPTSEAPEGADSEAAAETPEPAAKVDAGAMLDAGVDAGADAGADGGADAGADAGHDAATLLADAGAPPIRDAGQARDAAVVAAATPDAGPPGPARDGGTPLLAAYAPEGAQLALRLHMGLVRASPLAADVRALLEVIPDWKLVLDGSGIDPITDLERVYLASPNLQRSRLVIAGQYIGDDDLPRRAVANLAQARGVTARWQKLQGIPVAPWANADTTERIVALIAPKQFAITRREDLARVLAVAAELALRRAPDGGMPAAEALLALDEGDTLAVSIEGVHAFARGRTRALPQRLEAGARQLETGRIELHAVGHFASEVEAEQAHRFWERQRDAYATHPLVAFVGMAGPLRRAELAVEESRLTARTSLTLQQARLLLGFLRDALSPRPPPPSAPVPQGASPPSSGH